MPEYASLNTIKGSHSSESYQLSTQELDIYTNYNRCMCNSPTIYLRSTVHKLRMTPTNSAAYRNISEPKNHAIAKQDECLRCALEQLTVHIHAYHIKVLLLILAKYSFSKEN